MIDSNTRGRIELGIIGILLFHPDRAGEAIARLQPEVFSFSPCRGLFEAITALHFAGDPIDPVTILQKAGEDYEPAIDDAKRCATAPSNLEYYCDMLLDYAKLQNAQVSASAILAAKDLDEVRAEIEKLNGIMVEGQETEIATSKQMAADFFTRLDSETKPEYLTWGFQELDKVLYTELGDMIVIGGHTSAGKTLLSLQFALHIAGKYKVGYFSLETGKAKISDRIMAHMAQVPLGKIKTRDLNDADYAALADAGKRYHTLDFEFVKRNPMTVRDIQAISLNRRYQVIFVDYLQLIQGSGKSIYERVTNISLALHTLAQSCKITVVALAQLSREEKTKGKPKPPSISDFKESGQIEQDADVAMLLYASDPNDNTGRRTLKVGKNKEGRRLKMELDFDGPRQTMTPAVPSASEKFRELNRQIREAGHKQVSFEELSDDDDDIPF